MIIRNTVLVLPTAALLAVGLMSAAPVGAEESVTMVNWGGAWSEAVIGTYNEPYTAFRGVSLRSLVPTFIIPCAIRRRPEVPG